MNERVFWVAPQGDDGGDGSGDHPFSSLERARQAVRQEMDRAGQIGPLTVCLRGGTYPRLEPFCLGPEDSGTQKAPITWTAAPDEIAVLSGGARVTGWTVHEGKILRAPAPPRTAWAGTPRQLFYRGLRQRRSRWPKRDPAQPITGGWIVPEGPHPDLDPYQTLRYPEGAIPRHWERPDQAEVNLYAGYGWCTAVIPLLEVDRQRRVLRLARRPIDEDQQPWYFPMRITTHNRFFVENLLEELTEPGEWCYDAASRTLYFWPPDDAPPDGEVVVPVVDCLVRLRQVEWVRLVGLTFTCTTTGDDYHRQAVQQGLGAMISQQGCRYCGEALHLRDTRHCAVEDCTFDQVGGNAVYLERGSFRTRVRRNTISAPGFNGVVLAGDRNFYPLFCEVTDNEIHHVGRVLNYVAGVFLGISDGCWVAHNDLHDLPHHAVNLGSNGLGRNYVEYNRICRVCLEIHDTGAINSWMDLPYPWVDNDAERSGHVIRWNWIADVAGCVIEDGKVVADRSSRGIYLDDYTSNCLVWGNVIVRAGWGFQIHGGKHNIVENNILLDCCTALVPGGWVNRRPGLQHTKEMFRGNRFCRNLVVTSRPDATTYLIHGWNGMALERCDENLFHQPAAELRIEWAEHPEGLASSALDEWQELGFDRHSVIAAPLFADVSRLDLRLAPDSPALRLGFIPIPFDRIGIRPRSG